MRWFDMRILFLSSDINPLVSFLESNGEDVILITEKVTDQDIICIDPEFIISYNYRSIIKKPIIDRYNNSIINLHISLLPWNRGAHPNFWSFWDNTPKGITIHYMDEGIDTGDIIAQKELFFDDGETLKSTYEILHKEIQQLFIDNWTSIKSHQNKRITQKGKGTYHSTKDIELHWNKIVKKGGWDISIKELMSLKLELCNITEE